MDREHGFIDAPLEGFFPEVEHEERMRALKQTFLQRRTNGKIKFTVCKKIEFPPVRGLVAKYTLAREGAWVKELFK